MSLPGQDFTHAVHQKNCDKPWQAVWSMPPVHWQRGRQSTSLYLYCVVYNDNANIVCGCRMQITRANDILFARVFLFFAIKNFIKRTWSTIKYYKVCILIRLRCYIVFCKNCSFKDENKKEWMILFYILYNIIIRVTLCSTQAYNII